MRAVELFAGCGGLALGISQAGFEHVLVVELEEAACATLRENQRRKVHHVERWPVSQMDARHIDYGAIRGAVDLVTGGPPCQPFSIGGSHRGPGDPRNMWREAIRAVRELRPRAFLFENVRGLLRPAFAQYLEYLRLQLAWPEVVPVAGGAWRDQRRRLRCHAKAHDVPTYRVVVQGINAADYGAPQKRHRAIVLGVRSDLADELVFPAPTHSREALLWSQHVTEVYWKRHAIGLRHRAAPREADAALLARLWQRTASPPERPWVTVRDTIADLPKPALNAEPLPNHRLHPGARVYARHTGSSWDEPAKALKAGAHGVPGGENVLVLRNGSVRYFTLREMARLQGFPDDFVVGDGWKSPVKQLGNAVPVQVARSFGLAIRRLIAPVMSSGRRVRAA